MLLDLKQQILAFLGSKEDPTKLKSILKGLGLPANDRQYVRALLREMMREGQVVKSGSLYWVPDGKRLALDIKRRKSREKDQVVGRLQVTSAGFGFVLVERGRDWMIPETGMGHAMNGDVVVARRVGTERGGRITAEIVEIRSYGLHHLVGVFERYGKQVRFRPFSDFQLRPEMMREFPEDVEDGMVGKWTRQKDGTFAFGELLGALKDPLVDEHIVLAENDIPGEFEPRVMDEVAHFNPAFEFELGDRTDFRDELVFTVDGATARDFDDALHFKEIGAKEVEVGVHIADVSEFVKPGTALDTWAKQRGNSTYLPHKAIPMLPQILSNELCSLKPNVPRYTLSVVVRLSREGEVKSFRIHKGLICSRYRLTYDNVNAIGIDRDPNMRAGYAEVVPSLDLALELSRKMRKRRIREGGFDLDLAETVVEVDASQLMKKVVEKHQTDANRMIEAFMVMANECVARDMTERDITIPYRIHDAPDEDRLARLERFLSSHGIAVPHGLEDDPGPSLNALLEELQGKPNAQVMQTQVLKAMKMAEYLPENHGHFGLASACYCHFTSPIRRYADLIVHRRLTALLNATSAADLDDDIFDDSGLEESCSHISNRERASAKAENTYVLLKMLRHLEDRIGDDMEGVIDDVKEFGLFVRLNDFPVSGLVHVENLPGDYFEFVPDMLALVGARNGRAFKVGDEVKVKLMRVDFLSRKIDMGLALSRIERLEMGPDGHAGGESRSGRPRRAAASGGRGGARRSASGRSKGEGKKARTPGALAGKGKKFKKVKKGPKKGRRR